MTFNGETTTPLAFDATASDVQNALNALTTINGIGGVFLAVSSLLIYGPMLTGNFQLNPFWIAGVALALLVAVLAFVNLAFGYCLGCQIYYQLGKRGLIRA